MHLSRSLTVLASLGLMLGCSGSSSTLTLEGTLTPSDPTYQGISVAPYPIISVQGRSDSAFNVRYIPESSAVTQLAFRMEDLPKDERLIFSVSQAGQLDASLSFPITVRKGTVLRLGALPAGTVSGIYQAANNAGISFTPPGVTGGDIIGLISPNATGCAPYRKVNLLTSEGAQASGQGGTSLPIYFDPVGAANTSEISDTYCTYAILGVPAGSYLLQILTETSQVVNELSVTVVAGRTTFGYAQGL